MEKDILFFLIMFAICMLLVIIMVLDWRKPGDVYSKLPAPEPKPEPMAYGPLFLRIRFYRHAGIPGRPDIYLRADDIKSVIGDCHDSILTIEKGMETLKFEDVEQYSFVKMSQMGDFLFEEEL